MGVKEIPYPTNSFTLGQQALCAIMDSKDNGLGRFTGVPENVDICNRFFLRWYQKQDSFQEILGEAQYMLATSSEDANEAISRLSGGLFEDIASIYLIRKEAKNNSERTVVLTANVLSFFTDLYPNASVVHNTITTDSLKGASVPDGLIIDKLGIVSVCEYTLREGQQYFEDKYHKFRTKKRNFPELFANSNLLFVVPKTVRPAMEKIKENIGDSTVQFLELPFSRTEFRKFIEKVARGHGMVDDEKQAVKMDNI